MNREKAEQKLETILIKLEKVNESLDALVEALMDKADDFDETEDISDALLSASEDEGSVFNDIMRKVILIETYINSEE
jgi:hypothetical protein